MRHLTVREKFVRAIRKLPNLLAYYRCNEVSGTVCRNYAPGTRGSNNGTISGTTLGVSGKIGRCFSFNGTSDSVDLGDISSLKNIPAASNFTFGAFVFVKNSTTAKFALSSRAGSANTNPGYDILINFGIAGRCQARIADGANFYDTTYNATTGAWHFIVGVLDQTNTTLRLYVDGVERNTANTSGRADITSDQNPFIAKRATNFFDDKAQHVFMLNRALSAAEVLKLARIANFA